MVPNDLGHAVPPIAVDQTHNEQYPNIAGDKGSPPAFAPTEVVRDGAVLPKGSRLQEFEIEELVGEGGFSIVYRARDTLLGRTVALKEYLPASLARRGAGQVVEPRSARHRVTFELGLHSFINEAQLLASFDHPSLVKVYRFWEENGTAYMVMPLYEGQTLVDWLLARNAPASEAWLRALLAPLLDALELMHRDHCYHRDIAPDNVLLLDPVRGRHRQRARSRRCASPGAARLRRRAARDRRCHAGADRHPQTRLRADRAVLGKQAHAAGSVDRHLRAVRAAVLRGDGAPADRRRSAACCTTSLSRQRSLQAAVAARHSCA